MGVAVIVLGVSGLFGGLEKAERTVPSVAVSATIDGGPWLITVTKAQLHPNLPPMVLRDKANHWLVIVAKVEIAATESWTVLKEMIRLSGVEGLESKLPELLLVRDATKIGMLHPGMPEEVAFFWEQKAGTPVPKQVTVQVMHRTHRENSLTGAIEWLPDDDPVGEVTVPVSDRRAGVPSSTPSPKASS